MGIIGQIEKYFEPVVIERKTIDDDGWGPVESWATHITVQGRLRQLNGSERYSAGKDTTFSTHRLYCAVSDVTTADRVSYGGRKYNIHAVNDVMNFSGTEYPELMQIDCELIEA